MDEQEYAKLMGVKRKGTEEWQSNTILLWMQGRKNKYEKDLPSPRKYEFNATEAWLEDSGIKEGVGGKHKGCKD